MKQPILVDTHCHMNMMVKKEFDVPLNKIGLEDARNIAEQALLKHVKYIINVGTNIVESKNCILIAQKIPDCYATIGLHPNDAKDGWQQEFTELKKLLKEKDKNKIVGIGECGMDGHYPDHNFARQTAVFQAQIELALEHNLALVVHTRDAYDETLKVLEPYKNDIQRGVIHCFSEDQNFANTAIEWGFMLGIGGPLTYPKNEKLREVFMNVPIEQIVLETDAPFLAPQVVRGKPNHPKYIKDIADHLAKIRKVTYENVADHTTRNAKTLFQLP